jgi:hypothetical protein
MRGSLVVLGIVAAVAACGPRDAADRGPMTTRDSAGITILRNESPALSGSQAWSLAAVPELAIGSEADSTQQLYRVRGSARLASGRLAIANAGSSQIRIYDSAGNMIRAFGREGSGPGEFSYLDGIWPLPGDSVLAWDGDHQQLHTFDELGRHVRTVAFRVSLAASPRRYPNAEFLGLTGVHDTLPRSLNETWWESFTFVRLSSDGDSLDQIGPLRAMEYMATDWQGSQLRAERPLGHVAAFAVGPNTFYYGDSEHYRIQVFDPRGNLDRIVERVAEPQPITRQITAAYIRGRLDAATSPELRAEWERYFANVQFPVTAPAFRRFDVDSEGNLWVENWNVPGSADVTWSVFSPDGRWITDIQGPRGQPLEIGADYMILLVRTELGTEQVAVHRIMKPIRTTS